MPSSSRIIKSKRAKAEETSNWVINTAYDYKLEEEPTNDFYTEEAAEEIEAAQKKSEAIIQSAIEEREALLKEAHADIEQMKQDVRMQAYEKGFKEGYDTGFSEGMATGQKEATEMHADLMKQARQSITDAQLDIEAYVKEKKDSLLSLSVHMAEKIVHEQLDLSPEGILELVRPILIQLDQKEDYVSLTVHPSKRQFVRDRLPFLEKSYPGVRFSILQDETVLALGCIVESAHKVVNLQVKEQLEAMIHEMKESEREA